MFHQYKSLTPNALPPEKAERAALIAAGLPDSEIVNIVRRTVTLHLPNLDEDIEGDVTHNGYTVYLGGFDWVTFPTPPHLLQHFPEFVPLPQQQVTYQTDVTE
ncbi:MAG: hypothetical protein ACK2T6_07250 [Anaerolineae bacterium]